LTIEAGALLMMQPSELLQDLGVVGVAVEDAHVSALSRIILDRVLVVVTRCDEWSPYLFLLLVNMTNLEPNVFFTQWARRVIDNVLEALHHGQ